MTALALILGLGTAQAGESLPERLANMATQPDVVLVPPAGEPSPKIGSFVVPYAAPAGTEPDPNKVGTYRVAPSSCSAALVFKKVAASEDRKELWVLNSGVGVSIGLPQFGVSAGVSNKSMAGMEYVVDHKLILDTGLEELELCCLQHPDRCTGEYISEYWYGTGEIHRMTGSHSGIKASIKAIEKSGSVDYANTKGWSSSSKWTDPMYFAYRTQAFQLPDCEPFMNSLPEIDGKVLFTGVSERLPSEKQARNDARTDARLQVVKYLGEELQIEGDVVVSSAEALLSGVKDSLTCLDPVLDTPEGPHYLARVRMYVDADRLNDALSEMTSGN